MKIFDLLDRDHLEKHLGDKTVAQKSHPEYQYRILNYTPMCQFSNSWDDISEQCRGLIFDCVSEEVIARPWRKFFNYETASRPETQLQNLPKVAPIVAKKYDGSLGVGYRNPEGKMHVATRGSFDSEQSTWASAWIDCRNRQNWMDGWTPLWEIIYDANRIVVSYPFEGLVLLGMVHIETGVEMGYEDLQRMARANDMRCVEVFDKPLEVCVLENLDNEEGYVLSWPSSNAPSLKVKAKFGDYCRLHKLLTQTNAVTVWEMLRDGLDVETLTEDVPAEFRAWIDGVEKRLRDEFKAIEDAALAAMLAYPGEKKITNPADKKAFALYVTGQHADLAPILFAMIQGKDYVPIVWKRLRPRGDDRTFRVDAEG